MTYLWVKSLHLAAVLIFAGGLMLLAVITSRWAPAGAVLLPHEKRIGNAVLQWDRCVTMPAMAALWALGLGLAMWGGWMGQGWLLAKFAFAVALSGLHGVLAATLRRRMQSVTTSKPSLLRYSPAAIATCFAVIAVLVTLKP